MKFLNISNIKSANVEISTNCNAACPLCSRNYNGYGVRDNFPLKDMSMDEFKKLMDPVLANKPFLLSLCGTYGDPAANKQCLEILEYVNTEYPHVEIILSSNASMKTISWWANLAKISNLKIEFALDGLADTHHIYRQNTSWQKVINNATAFIQAGGYAVWQFIQFEHNKHQFYKCKDLSRQLGFAEFKHFDDNRSNGIAFKPDGTPFVLGTSQQQPITAPEFVEQEKYLQRQYELNLQHEFDRDLKVDTIECYSQEGNIYVAVNGDIWPCCWLGGTFPLTSDSDNGWQLKKLPVIVNGLEHSLEEIIASWNYISNTWDTKEPLSTCVRTCGKCQDYDGMQPVGVNTIL
jgi:MoaA/NifB/PqqE/SkfB family radical SAM enzyme